jgi:2-polyprenyl-3-methyl-5-hydroxy-6-metoxy-1,4-benzoquinol methylase
MLRSIFRGASKTYSVQAERDYYSKSRSDRSASSYTHLDAYVRGSVGLDFFRGKSVLDIGCGEGVYSAWIADRGGAKNVLGIELTDHRIRWEYQERLANLRFEVADILAHDFGGQQFDIVFFNLVLHHLRFELPRVGEIVVSSLREGGCLLAFEPNVYSPLAVLAHLIHSRSANEGFLSPGQIRRSLEQTGMRDISNGFFWRERRWARNAFLGSSFWLTARKPALSSRCVG